jgi:hypothetical protein
MIDKQLLQDAMGKLAAITMDESRGTLPAELAAQATPAQLYELARRQEATGIHRGLTNPWLQGAGTTGIGGGIGAAIGGLVGGGRGAVAGGVVGGLLGLIAKFFFKDDLNRAFQWLSLTMQRPDAPKVLEAVKLQIASADTNAAAFLAKSDTPTLIEDYNKELQQSIKTTQARLAAYDEALKNPQLTPEYREAYTKARVGFATQLQGLEKAVPRLPAAAPKTPPPEQPSTSKPPAEQPAAAPKTPPTEQPATTEPPIAQPETRPAMRFKTPAWQLGTAAANTGLVRLADNSLVPVAGTQQAVPTFDEMGQFKQQVAANRRLRSAGMQKNNSALPTFLDGYLQKQAEKTPDWRVAAYAPEAYAPEAYTPGWGSKIFGAVGATLALPGALKNTLGSFRSTSDAARVELPKATVAAYGTPRRSWGSKIRGAADATLALPGAAVKTLGSFQSTADAAKAELPKVTAAVEGIRTDVDTRLDKLQEQAVGGFKKFAPMVAGAGALGLTALAGGVAGGFGRRSQQQQASATPAWYNQARFKEFLKSMGQQGQPDAWRREYTPTNIA